MTKMTKKSHFCHKSKRESLFDLRKRNREKKIELMGLNISVA